MPSLAHASAHSTCRRHRRGAGSASRFPTPQRIHRGVDPTRTRGRAPLGRHRGRTRSIARHWARLGRRPRCLGPRAASSGRTSSRVIVYRLLLDSTVLIDALRGRCAATHLARLRRTGTEPWVCAISVEEVWRGLRSDEEPVARRLFTGLRLAPLGVTEGIRAGTWRREFAQRGITVHQADCLIAAAAVGIGASLATANVSDFPMVELSVDHWPAGM